MTEEKKRTDKALFEEIFPERGQIAGTLQKYGVLFTNVPQTVALAGVDFEYTNVEWEASNPDADAWEIAEDIYAQILPFFQRAKKIIRGDKGIFVLELNSGFFLLVAPRAVYFGKRD